ncbi:hypothetical protein GWI33_014803 [Rhynchophorus ferrugineus]|uniref:Uncharacterized protein n=1 Tax=Rhynchophorus ferrugineus TaxID=354439 RepID=A0A834M8R3_RHYFE|nr:hypothetical protein GWI33_014803 [Rhynchophorus ferrugineus]
MMRQFVSCHAGALVCIYVFRFRCLNGEINSTKKPIEIILIMYTRGPQLLLLNHYKINQKILESQYLTLFHNTR